LHKAFANQILTGSSLLLLGGEDVKCRFDATNQKWSDNLEGERRMKWVPSVFYTFALFLGGCTAVVTSLHQHATKAHESEEEELNAD
jgi:hypothetical protein